MTLIFAFLIPYLLGSIPVAYLIVKLFTGKNILDHGTGNVGTMNTHRTTNNKFLTLLVLFGDLFKGLFSYLIIFNYWDLFLTWSRSSYTLNSFSANYGIYVALAGFALILGHNYSLFLKFKGGKGLAAGAGFLLGLYPILVPIWGLIFFAIVAISKYMVLAQLVASFLLPIFAFITGNTFVALVILPMSILVVLKHSPRMKNILDGSEPKMYYKIRSNEQK